MLTGFGDVTMRTKISKLRARGWTPASLVLVALGAHASDWTPVGTDDEGNTYSVDASRAVRDGSLVRVQVRTEYARPRHNEAAGKDVFVALDRMSVDCSKGTFAVESRTYVAADGTEIPRGSTPREDLRFRPAAAGSMSEAIVQFVCRPAGHAKSGG